MTPKQKAKELIEKMSFETHRYNAISCALVTVNEICKLRLNIGQYLKTDEDKENYYSYWEQVKEEIENYNTNKSKQDV